MVENTVRFCVNFEEFSPCCVLDVFHLESDGDMTIDI